MALFIVLIGAVKQSGARIVGLGAAKNIGSAVASLGARKAMVVTDRLVAQAGLLDRILSGLTEMGIEQVVFDRCEPNAPLETIEQCMEVLRREICGVIVGLGGGSVMDTAKLVSLWMNTGRDIRNYVGVNKVEPHREQVAKILIPTTVTGSEWGRNAVFLDRATGTKNSISSSCLTAQRVIIDPELMADLPRGITAETGIDALSHAIEAYTTIKASLISDMLA